MDNEFMVNDEFKENLSQAETNENALEKNAGDAELDVLFDEIDEVKQDATEEILAVQDETFSDDNAEEIVENEMPASTGIGVETKPRAVGVYVKVNEEGFVTDVRSDLFIDNFDGWIKIDEGDGDRFVHAQACYFDTPLVDNLGNFQVKL